MKFLLVLLFFIPYKVEAGKWIDLSWDGVRGAKGYEIELTRIQDNDEFPLGIFKSKKPTWKKSVKPGLFRLRIRSLDSRGVPGEWGEPFEVTVDIDSIDRYRPKNKELIPNVNLSKTLDVDFVWERIEGLEAYHLLVKELDGKTIFDEEVKGTSKRIKLPVAKKYTWSLSAIIDGEKGKGTKVWQFTPLGPSLSAPLAEVESGDKGVNFKFSHDQSNVKYKFKILRSSKGRLKKMVSKKSYSKNLYSVNRKKMRKGIYKLEVQATLEDYNPSFPKVVEFEWDGSDIKLLGKGLERDREYRRWFLSFKGEYNALDYESKTGSTSSGFTTKMPALRTQVLWGKKFGIGDIGVLIDFAALSSSQDSYKDTTLGLYYGWYQRKWGWFGFSVSNTLFRRSTFIVESNNLLQSKTKNTTSITGVEFNLGAHLYWNENWSFSMHLAPNFSFSADSEIDGFEADKIDLFRLEVKAAYKVAEKMDIFLSANNSETNIEYNSGGSSSSSLQGSGIGMGVDIFY